MGAGAFAQAARPAVACLAGKAGGSGAPEYHTLRSIEEVVEGGGNGTAGEEGRPWVSVEETSELESSSLASVSMDLAVDLTSEEENPYTPEDALRWGMGTAC